MELVQTFLEARGDTAYANDGITKNRYVVVDCQGKAKKPQTLRSLAVKYRNVPFVIFNNCENILKNEETLALFRHLMDGNRRITLLDENGGHEDFEFGSWYILLGSENKMHETLEKTKPDLRGAVEYRINTFQGFIKPFNF